MNKQEMKNVRTKRQANSWFRCVMGVRCTAIAKVTFVPDYWRDDGDWGRRDLEEEGRLE